ncbi:MAG: hypothetical protein GY842_21350 [bacterium]|nr:hypothetical protein [bacterium]
MPRPSKTVRRQCVNAGLEYKRGNRTEAYKIWAKAAASRLELQAKKKKNQQGKVAEEAPADEAASPPAEG